MVEGMVSRSRPCRPRRHGRFNAQSRAWVGMGGQARRGYEDIQRLLISRGNGLRGICSILWMWVSDNGMTLKYSPQAENGEPAWSNIFVRNFETRINEIWCRSKPQMTTVGLVKRACP